MVFQPASILTTITGEIFVQLRQHHPTLKLWTVVERNDALATSNQIYFTFNGSAYGYIELLCRPAASSLQDRHIYGKFYGKVSHLQLDPDLTFHDLQTTLKEVGLHCQFTIHFKPNFTPIFPGRCETCEPYEIATSSEELNHQFNIENDHPAYTQFAHELTKDAITWIEHITPLLRHQPPLAEDTQ